MHTYNPSEVSILHFLQPLRHLQSFFYDLLPVPETSFFSAATRNPLDSLTHSCSLPVSPPLSFRDQRVRGLQWLTIGKVNGVGKPASLNYILNYCQPVNVCAIRSYYSQSSSNHCLLLYLKFLVYSTIYWVISAPLNHHY